MRLRDLLVINILLLTSSCSAVMEAFFKDTIPDIRFEEAVLLDYCDRKEKILFRTGKQSYLSYLRTRRQIRSYLSAPKDQELLYTRAGAFYYSSWLGSQMLPPRATMSDLYPVDGDAEHATLPQTIQARADATRRYYYHYILVEPVEEEWRRQAHEVTIGASETSAAPSRTPDLMVQLRLVRFMPYVPALSNLFAIPGPVVQTLLQSAAAMTPDGKPLPCGLGASSNTQ